MKNIVITQLICGLQHANFRRADQAVIGLPVIHLALNILDTVVNTIQLCFCQKLRYQGRDIFLDLHAGLMKLLREMLCKIYKAVIFQVIKVQTDTDDLQRRKHIVECHDLITKQVYQAAHMLYLLRDPRMIRADALDGKKILRGLQVVVHNRRISHKALIHKLHHIRLNGLEIAFVAFYDLVQKLRTLKSLELILSKYKVMPESHRDPVCLFIVHSIFQKLSSILAHIYCDSLLLLFGDFSCCVIHQSSDLVGHGNSARIQMTQSTVCLIACASSDCFHVLGILCAILCSLLNQLT